MVGADVGGRGRWDQIVPISTERECGLVRLIR